MQLRFRTGLTGEQYVTAQGWLDATLVRCPNHPSGGCSLARHGTYERKTPPGTHIARWYCPESHTTFSRLPDCLAARLPGTLAELEEAVVTAERSPTVTAAAAQLRSTRSEPPGTMRWLRRRMRLVRRVLTTVIGLLPERFANSPPTILAFRDRFSTDAALVWLRELATPQLKALPTPLGFAYPARPLGLPSLPSQQQMGPDPPLRRA